jgi:hypothetical protein
MSGFHIAVAVAASILLAAAFVAYRYIPGRKALQAAAEAPIGTEPVAAH